MRAGLAEPVLGSQQIFRAVLDTMSHPGRVVSVPPPLETPAPLWPATASICLTLVDGETSVWLDAAARRADVIEYLRFHCGCPIVTEAEDARFAVAWLEHSGYDSHRCGFAGAVWSNQSEEISGLDLEVEALERLRAVAVALEEPTSRYGGAARSGGSLAAGNRGCHYRCFRA